MFDSHLEVWQAETAVSASERARSHRYPDPGYPYRLRVTTQTYGELASRPDIWEHGSAGTMVSGCWGPYRIFANVPLSAIDVYPVRKEN